MLILGSKSPRRREILEKEGFQFIVKSSDAKEDITEDNPYLYPMLTAIKKAQEIEISDEDILLCADTIVYADNKILGKPRNIKEAFKMIKTIEGKYHEVVTGVFLKSKMIEDAFYEVTKVYVKKLTDEEINEYINTKEPYDKAGGYAIQGIFSKYIEKIDGDYNNVVGLPVTKIKHELNKFI